MAQRHCIAASPIRLRRADRPIADVRAFRRGGARSTLLLAMIPVVLIGIGGTLAYRLSVSTQQPASNGAGTSLGDIASAQDADVLATMTIPEFRAVDQDGREQSRAIFTRPRTYTVLNFVFTRCTTVCPITTGQMVRVQDAIKEIPGQVAAPDSAPAPNGSAAAPAGKQFRLVSFSVDPTRDTPAAMKAHAEAFADFSLWTFVSSDASTVKAVVEQGLGFALEEEKGARIDLGNGESMANIIHPSKMLLISPEGKVVGMYRGMDEEDVSRLISRLKAISRER